MVQAEAEAKGFGKGRIVLSSVSKGLVPFYSEDGKFHGRVPIEVINRDGLSKGAREFLSEIQSRDAVNVPGAKQGRAKMRRPGRPSFGARPS